MMRFLFGYDYHLVTLSQDSFEKDDNTKKYIYIYCVAVAAIYWALDMQQTLYKHFIFM